MGDNSASNLDFIANLIGALAWPAVVVFIVIVFRKPISGLFSKENMIIKVGDFELNLANVAEKANKETVELSKRVADLETFVFDNHSIENTPPDNSNIQEETTTELMVYGMGSQKEQAPIKKYTDPKTKKVLWVDDYPSNNAFIIERLAQDGIDVTIKASTDDALEILEFKNFDAIISDLGRKEKGYDNPNAGIEFIEAVRRKNISTPIIIFAGERALRIRDKLINIGAENATNSSVELFRFLEKHIGVKN